MSNDPPERHEPLIAAYHMELDSPPCKPGAPTWSARICLDTSIDELLPYLNARLEGADYDHKAKILIWKTKAHSFAFRSREIRAAPARDREEARQLIERAVTLANEAWAERDRIQPRFEGRIKPNLMQIYRQLPRTNCGECGCSTCMAFAARILEGDAGIDCCPQLEQAEYRESRAGLEALLGSTGGQSSAQ